MELDMVADMEVDKVADMVADIEVDMVADIDINMEIQFGERVGHGAGLLQIWNIWKSGLAVSVLAHDDEHWSSWRS